MLGRALELLRPKCETSTDWPISRKDEINLSLAYLLGYHLGDGCLTTGGEFGNSNVKYESIDRDTIQLVQCILHTEFDSNVQMSYIEAKHVWKVVSEKTDVIVWFVKQLEWRKRWPNVDEFSVAERKCMLAGLLDSDGFVSIQRDHFYQKNGRLQYSPFKCLIGFCNTAEWFEDVVRLIQSLGGVTGKITSTMNVGKGYTRTKPIKRVYIRPNSFIESGLFFASRRKNAKVAEIAKEKGLSISSEAIRTSLLSCREDMVRSA